MSDVISSGWFSYSSKGQRGPYSPDQLRAMIASGELGQEDYAWYPGMSGWKRVREIEELKKGFYASMSESMQIAQETAAENARVQSVINKPPVAESAPVQPLKAPTSHAPVDHSAKIRILGLMLLSSTLGGLFYLGLSHVDSELLTPSGLWSRLFNPFPRLPGIDPTTYEGLKTAALTPITIDGPRLELALGTPQALSPYFYLATNLPDGTRFDIHLVPIVTTLITDAVLIPPLTVIVNKHIGKSPNVSPIPGYYWIQVYSSATQANQSQRILNSLRLVSASQPSSFAPLGSQPVLDRKFFLGGVPDLGYQTRLRDFLALRKGKAQAELERLRDLHGRMETLLSSDKKAATSLIQLRFEIAKQEAWGLFNPTWTKGFAEIEERQKEPMRFFGKTLEAAASIPALLQRLHEKHHSLIKIEAVRAPKRKTTSSRLAPEVIGEAQTLAEAHLISAEISHELAQFHNRIEEVATQLASSSGWIDEESGATSTGR